MPLFGDPAKFSQQYKNSTAICKNLMLLFTKQLPAEKEEIRIIWIEIIRIAKKKNCASTNFFLLFGKFQLLVF